jgi:hypothetical protein
LIQINNVRYRTLNLPFRSFSLCRRYLLLSSGRHAWAAIEENSISCDFALSYCLLITETDAAQMISVWRVRLRVTLIMQSALRWQRCADRRRIGRSRVVEGD